MNVGAPSDAELHAAADEAVRAELGKPPDTHPVNYALAGLALVALCVGIPANWHDRAEAAAVLAAVALANVVLNRTLLREHNARLDAYRARRAAILAEMRARARYPEPHHDAAAGGSR